MINHSTQESALLETILNSIDEGIHVVNSEGKTIFYNHRAAAIDGFEPEEVMNKHIFEIYPSLTNETSTLIRTLLTSQPTEERQQTFINKKGQKITTVNKTIPVRLQDQSLGALEISREITQLQELVNRISQLQNELHHHTESQAPLAHGTRYTFDQIIGKHPDLIKAIDYARKAARTSSSILLYGETGTGKEVFAQSIHNASPRRNKPFIAQNCAALPKDLLEGLLFGTEKGSFTGAISRAGLFEQANGGTLLLDEINSMDVDLQAKLLRVLQDGRVRRIGGNMEKEIDVRIIASSNVPPEKALKERQIREDLFYRLSVVLLRIPPLRERLQDDLAALVQHFIQSYNQRFQKRIHSVSPTVMNLFIQYQWPGNIRELQHIIEGAFNLLDTPETQIHIEHLPTYLEQRIHNQKQRQPEHDPDTVSFVAPLILPANRPLTEVMEELECRLIANALKTANGNISQAANALAVKRQALQYKIKKYNL
jgi:arginine utilization regulatory protein